MIALTFSSQIIQSWIYKPITQDLMYAKYNNGTFLNNKKIKVSRKKRIEGCLFATGGKKEAKLNLLTRKSGSAALDMAYVAAGRYDGYFQDNLNLWDVAAGIIIIKEAGGIVNEIDLLKKSNIKIRASSIAINDIMNEKLLNY